MNQRKTTMTVPSKGLKFDQDKGRYDLVPPFALDEIVKVLTIGSKKYADENWRDVEGCTRRYFAAANRHLWAPLRGESHDPETGLHHWTHAACCLLFLVEIASGKKDNKPKFD